MEVYKIFIIRGFTFGPKVRLIDRGIFFSSPDTERATSGHYVQKPPVSLCGGILVERGRQRYNILVGWLLFQRKRS